RGGSLVGSEFPPRAAGSKPDSTEDLPYGASSVPTFRLPP
ncbi:hypothetical protein AVEN_73924-1, partial [Araneus ventricosus]